MHIYTVRFLDDISALLESHTAYVVTTGIVLAFFMGFILILSHTAAIRRKALKKNLKLQEGIALALSDAKSANETKSRFIANISHEVRTPLTSLIGILEQILDSRPLDPKTLRDIERVYLSGMDIKHIVDDLLYASRIEAGKFKLIEEEYDVSEMIFSILSQNSHRFSKKPLIEFQKIFSCGLPQTLIGDELRIKQICSNLLSNAAKFTDSGVVLFSVKSFSVGDEPWLSIGVQDTGKGIPKDDLPNVFDEYYQAGGHAEDLCAGTGLGLALVKMLAEQMGGSVAVRSKPGAGSHFVVKVRQRRPELNKGTIPEGVLQKLEGYDYANIMRKHKQKIVKAPVPYANVLLVDDIPSNLEVLKGFLKPYQMNMDLAYSGKEAVELIKKDPSKYSAVFMDYTMPGMNGLDATRVIRGLGHERLKGLPVFAFTANSIEDSQCQFSQEEFQDFIGKPIDAAHLDRVINKWIRKKGEGGGETAHNGIPGHSARARPGILRIEGLDIQECVELFGGDAELFTETLLSFSKNISALIEKAHYPQKDALEDYATTLHSIKGSLRIIHENALSKRSEALEKAAWAGDYEFIRTNNNEFLNDLASFAQSVKYALRPFCPLHNTIE